MDLRAFVWNCLKNWMFRYEINLLHDLRVVSYPEVVFDVILPVLFPFLT